MQGRMNQSTVDFITVNLLGSKKFASKRVPITCLEGKYFANQLTTQAIQAVVAWGLQSLGEGKYPAARHDGSSLDKPRAKHAGQFMPGKAALVQMRGDWDWNCKWYGASAWNELQGMCWLCKAKPEEWPSMSFEDRQSQNMAHADLVKKLEIKRKSVSPLFSLPGVTNRTMTPDWMRVVDEGCAASAAGQVLAELQRRCAGSSKKERAQALWKEIQSLYESNGVAACRRLKNLTVKHVQKPGKAAVLDAKAAEVRHFCTDILEHLAKSKKLQEGSMRDKAVYNVAKHCTDMFRHLEIFNSKVKSGEKFMSQ